MSNHALHVLQQIQESTFRNSAPMPLRESVQPEWQGIGFQLGGVRLVAPMGEVGEVMKVPRLTALPGVQPWVLGVANIRGRLIPVIDMHEYLELRPTLPSAQWRVLVIEDEDVAAGLLIEQSLGIQHFVSDSFEQELGDLPPALARYTEGAFRHGGRIYYQVALRSVLRDERFFDVAV